MKAAFKATKRTVFLLACLFLAAPCHAAEDKIDRAVEAFEAQRAAGFTGYAIIVHQGEIVFSRGAGIADALSGASFSETTQFDIASITKTITGLLIAEEIAQGRLTPDASLRDFFDVAESLLEDITIQQLLTHTAGLVDAAGEDAKVISLQDIVIRAAQTPLLY